MGQALAFKCFTVDPNDLQEIPLSTQNISLPIPLDKNLPISPLIISLPKELWHFNILSYFSFKEKANLRLICLWFRFKIVLYPAWKQWIPFSQLKTTINIYKKFNWPIEIEGVTFKSKEVSDYNFASLPRTIRAVDLGSCIDKVTDKYICSNLSKSFLLLPSDLKVIVIPRKTISTNAVLALQEAFPKWEIQFAGQINCLYWACIHGKHEFIQSLFKKKPQLQEEINTMIGYYGIPEETILYVACRNGHRDLVKFLLQQGADPDIFCTFLQYTPLMISIRNSHLETIKILLQFGASVYIKNPFGIGAFDVATRFNVEAYKSIQKFLENSQDKTIH